MNPDNEALDLRNTCYEQLIKASSENMALKKSCDELVKALEYAHERLTIEAENGRYPVSFLTTEGGQGFDPINKALAGFREREGE